MITYKKIIKNENKIFQKKIFNYSLISYQLFPVYMINKQQLTYNMKTKFYGIHY